MMRPDSIRLQHLLCGMSIAIMLALSIVSVGLGEQHRIAISKADAAAVDNMNTRELLAEVARRGLSVQSSVDDILQSVSFDDVFNFMTANELADAIVREGYARSALDGSTLLNQARSRGINVDILRNDGIITALAVTPNGPLLTQRSGRQLWNIATDTKSALRTAFENDRAEFLNVLSPRRVLALFDDQITSSASAARISFDAYSTQPVASDLTNIIPVAKYWNTTTVAELKAATDRQPVGKHVIQIVHYDAESDFLDGVAPPLRDGSGTLIRQANGEPLYSLWLDEWENIVTSRTRDFFTQFKESGGTVDTAIMDIEMDWLSHYYARTIWSEGKQDLILQDPRWPALWQRMNAVGITDLTNFALWYPWKDYRTVLWDSVMQRLQAEAYTRTTYEPLHALFPNIRFTNYENHHRNQTVPYGNYRKYPRSEFSIGDIVGTHQSVNLYGGEATVTKDGTIDAASGNPETGYDLFVGDVKGMRTMISTSRTPIMPWIAHRDWLHTQDSSLDTTYYLEMIFHVGLGRPDAFLNWIWSRLDTTISPTQVDAGNRALDAALKELTSLVGYADARPLSFENIDYQDGYVLTGIDAGGRRIWRLTPDPRASFSLISTSPVTFRVGSRTITIPYSSILSVPGTTSTLGYWISQTHGKSALTVSADAVYQALQSTPPPTSNTSTSASSRSQSSRSVSSYVTDQARSLNEVEILRLERSERLINYHAAASSSSSATSIKNTAPTEAHEQRSGGMSSVAATSAPPATVPQSAKKQTGTPGPSAVTQAKQEWSSSSNETTGVSPSLQPGHQSWWARAIIISFNGVTDAVSYLILLLFRGIKALTEWLGLIVH